MFLIVWNLILPICRSIPRHRSYFLCTNFVISDIILLIYLNFEMMPNSLSFLLVICSVLSSELKEIIIDQTYIHLHNNK